MHSKSVAFVLGLALSVTCVTHAANFDQKTVSSKEPSIIKNVAASLKQSDQDAKTNRLTPLDALVKENKASYQHSDEERRALAVINRGNAQKVTATSRFGVFLQNLFGG